MKFIPADQLHQLLDPRQLVSALRQGFHAGATVPTRHHHTIPRADADATLLLMPAWSSNGQIGVKMVTVFPSNSEKSLPSIYGTYTLLDEHTGAPLALMDGRILTLYRTAATSVLAATYLARKDSKSLLMIGTGALAPHIINTYAEVLGIQEVQLWGRTPAKASKLATHLTRDNLHVTVAEDLADAAGRADIISCATLSKTPLIHGEWLSPGCFVDLIGGYTPQMREADDEVIRKASIFVDTRPGALSEAGDIMIPIQKGLISADDLRADLFDLVAERHAGRQNDSEITLFKSTGYALEDLVAAQLAYSKSIL